LRIKTTAGLGVFTSPPEAKKYNGVKSGIRGRRLPQMWKDPKKTAPRRHRHLRLLGILPKRASDGTVYSKCDTFHLRTLKQRGGLGRHQASFADSPVVSNMRILQRIAIRGSQINMSEGTRVNRLDRAQLCLTARDTGKKMEENEN
jgi:hypothetical protein